MRENVMKIRDSKYDGNIKIGKNKKLAKCQNIILFVPTSPYVPPFISRVC